MADIRTINGKNIKDATARNDIANIKTELGTADLTTTNQTIKGGINEVNSRINTLNSRVDNIANNSGGSSGGSIDTSSFATKAELNTNLSQKQDKLVSGTNIKTINGQSLLGNGNIAITGGSSTGGTTGRNKEVTPEMYGAVGDGVADDTAAVQAAIDACTNGGKVFIYNTYKITSTLTVKLGVTLEGINDGLWCTSSKLLAAISNNTPVIKFGSSTTGIKLKDFSINPFNDSYQGKYDGIEFNSSEHTEVSNVYVTYARYGYYFTSTDRPNYLVDMNNVSATHCDIGIYFPPNPGKWSNGIRIKIKELSWNRIGMVAYHGDGNTIIGESAEVGDNTEMAINIKGGFYELKGCLWIEDTLRGIVLDGGVLCINGEIYTIKSIERNGGVLLQNVDLLFTNYTPKKLCYHDLKMWLSFDGGTSLTNYANGNTITNSGCPMSTEGVYGHSANTQADLFKGSLSGFDATKDWTLAVLAKVSMSSGDQATLFTFNDTSGYYYRILLQRIDNLTHLRVVSDNSTAMTNGNFNLGGTYSGHTRFEWFIVTYDSTNHKMTIYNQAGVPAVANATGSINIQNATNSNSACMGQITNALIDEFILYNRKLDSDEIRALTHMDILPPPNLK